MLGFNSLPNFPKTLLEFQRLFPDEAACAAYLVQIRWPEGFGCPACGVVGELALAERGLRSSVSVFPSGVDLVQPFQVAWYNRASGDAFKFPDLGRSSALGVLMGNTRALWPRFLDWLRANPRRLDEDHPLERYVAEVVLQALQPLAHRWKVRFAQEPPPRRVAMQRLAHLSGLAYLSPSHLNVHAMFGSWIALRTAVVIDIDGPPRPSSEPLNPCPDCERDYLPKFRHAAAAAGSTPEAHAAVEQHWRLWLSVPDACPVGREYRYSDDQIGYHYTKDRDRLKRALGATGP